MKCRKIGSIDMNSNCVMNSDFMSLLYSKPLKKIQKKRKLTIGDHVRIFKDDLILRKGY